MIHTRIATFAAHSTGTSRSETLMGQEYLVVPAVLVRSQVLNNNLGASFIPPSEFTVAWAEEWNGIPVVAGNHPTERGIPVSARQPSILNARGVGYIFGAKVREEESGDRHLHADIYLNASRAETVPELQEILNKLDAGETVELSTGFPVHVENLPGRHGEEAYELVMRPMGADHLSIFAELIGACSVVDGCGLGVNHAGACIPDSTDTQQEDEPVTVSEQEGTPPEVTEGAASTDAEGAASTDAEGAVQTTADEQGTDTRPPSFSVWARLKNFVLGLTDAGNESDDARRRALYELVSGRFVSDPRTYVWIEDVYSDEGYVIYAVESPGDMQLYRSDFTEDEPGVYTLADPVPVRRVTTYEPVVGNTQNQEEDTMTRDEMLNALSERGPLGRDALNKLSDCELRTLFGGNVEEKPEVEAQAAPEATPEATPQDAEPGEPVTAEHKNPRIPAEVTETINQMRERMQRLEALAAPAIQAAQAQRTELIESLAANSRVEWTREELESKTDADLSRIANLARGKSYAVRGGPRAVENADAEPQFMEPTPYWSANEPKEA